MITGCTFVLTIALGLQAAAQADQKVFAELQGTWKLVDAKCDDPAVARLDANFPMWIIKGNKVLYGGEQLAVLTVDPSTTPKTIDLDLRKSKRVFEGVYAVEGDKLKICVNRQTEGAKNRPVDFTTDGKPDWLLLVFQRAKAGEAADGVSGFVGIAIGVDKDRNEVSIGSIIEGSPAQKAGLKQGDVLLKVGGGAATDLKTVVGLVRQARPNSDLTFRIQRDGKELEIVVRVGVVPFFPLN